MGYYNTPMTMITASGGIRQIMNYIFSISRSAALKAFFAMVLSFCVLAMLPEARAQSSPHTVRIVGAGDNMVYVVQADALGDTSRAASLQMAINNNLSLIPFFRIINPEGIPGGGGKISSPSAEGIDFKRFAMSKAHMLVTSNWLNSGQVELRCYEVTQGRFMFGNRYTLGSGQSAVDDVADKFCAELLEAIIGNGAFFRSHMAFIKSEGRSKSDVWSVKPNGRYLTRLTSMPGLALSPAWSPDGGKVLFTHIDKRSHGLGIYDTRSKTTQRVKFRNSVVIGPTYLPNGSVAVSLSEGMYPSIFQLSSGFQKQQALARSSAIDVSASVDASGRHMVFTSSRMGGPQIFLKDLYSGAERRVSQSGGYNTDPSISPDGSMVVFARQEAGGHRIYVHDLATGQERQLTYGPGSDEEPAFAPDSYFIAFMSTRNGKREIYITTRNGGEPRRVPTGSGDAAFPAWGPALP